jgi:hypothetical protein
LEVEAMKHFVKGSVFIAVGISFAGFALASGTPALDAATVEAGLMAAAPIKLSVAEQFAKTGVWADSDSSASLSASADGPASVSVGSGGVITISYGTGAAIVLTPADGGNGRVNWSCSSSALPNELVPKGCSQPAA